MGTFSLEELLQQWGREDMTTEQAVGHLIQHIKLLHEELPPLRRGVIQAGRLDERLQRLERAAEAAIKVLSKAR